MRTSDSNCPSLMRISWELDAIADSTPRGIGRGGYGSKVESVSSEGCSSLHSCPSSCAGTFEPTMGRSTLQSSRVKADVPASKSTCRMGMDLTGKDLTSRGDTGSTANTLILWLLPSFCPFHNIPGDLGGVVCRCIHWNSAPQLNILTGCGFL